MQPHPKGTTARVLLSSVFGPYARDDQFGSRAINPMELFQNQVTRAQGAFSLRMFHRSWGIMMIQENISAPCTVLDFPTRERFAEELKRERYDIVGITSIIVNVGKVREMCRMVRELSPHSTIVVGGHVAAIPGLERMIDADHIVKGEGIAWMREFLGEDPKAPVRHPRIISAFGAQVMGVRDRPKRGDTAAAIIPSVGCPMGCNFCTTSAFFGGKGKSVDFYKTGEELFRVLCDAESALGVQSFFVMDENFLLNRPRALELLRLMKEHGKPWAFYVFSSANAIRKYTIEELVAIGVSWIWLGLESPRSGYAKLNGADTRKLASDLRAHGIKVLGSTIVGMEHHTPDNIRGEIEYAISHNTDFHQFMLYTPVPGTPLYQQMVEERRLIDMDPADIHGQFKFNFRHGAISRDQSKQFLDWAFQRDFERNGPSLYRVCKTTLDGWRRYKDCADERVRRRFEWEVKDLKATYAWLLWAMEKSLKTSDARVSKRIRSLRRQLSEEFGFLRTRVVAGIIGPAILWRHRREEKRLARGITYEPPTFVERKNWAEA